MLNRERTWRCASQLSAVAVARHFLGDACRVVEACSKPTWPGAPAQVAHIDSAGDFRRVPDVPWMINSMWMLTDFTADNGVTIHMARAHRGVAVRVGLNVAYYPRWFNNWVEGGHQPVWPETFARMPAEMQKLCTGRQSHSRDDACEIG